MIIPKKILEKIMPFLEGDAPHGTESTTKALNLIDDLPKMKKIADVGCGRGLQTTIIYKKSNALIFGLDDKPEYINFFKKILNANNYSGYSIKVSCSSLIELPFKEEELDMIWCEYAAVELGFSNVLRHWNRYIDANGYISICAYCWTREHNNKILTNFWKDSKMDIDTIENRIKQMADAGFVPVSYFILPEHNWWNYYSPFDVNTEEILEKYPHDKDIRDFDEKMKYEINLFEKFGDYYCYAFFIGRKYRW